MNIRVERPEDFRIVEEIIRDAFWNLYVPGCDEHLIAHRLRQSKDFIPELSLVGTEGDHIIAHILYSRSQVIADDGSSLETVTFGPVSVRPEYQNKGYGSRLIKYSIEKARDMGESAIIIYGYPGYYHRFGFCGGKKFGISRPDGVFMPALMVLPLDEKRVISGKFYESQDFQVNPEELELFDQNFPPKIKQIMPSQEKFRHEASLTE